MDRKTEGFLHILFALAIAAAVLYFSDQIEALGAYGYAGAFLIALLGSATILFPAPVWVVVVSMSTRLDPVLLGAVVGVGSAIGELTGYLAGEGVRELLNSRFKEAKDVERLVRRYGMAAVFVLAFLPNPVFDVAGLAAGGLKMRWWRYLVACAAGRVIRYVLLAMLGAFTLGMIW